VPRAVPPILYPGLVVVLLAACTSTGGDAGGTAGARTVVEIDAGNFHTCVRLGDGTAECWGQCGSHCGMRPSGTAERLPVVGLQHAVELAVGDSHACARLEDGHVACWGSNYSGGLGQPTLDASPMPLLVPDLDRVVEIDIGGDRTCARRADGTVTCWGRAPGDHQNGAEATARRMPAVVAGVADALALAVDGAHACAQVGAPYRWSCWYGRGGLFDSVPRMGSGARNAELDGVGEFSHGTCDCLRTSEGAVRCTGTGILSAQLGDGSSPPVQLHVCPADGLTGVRQMVDRCAIMRDGTVRCWGGLFAPVGGGAPIWSDSAKPTTIEGVTDVVGLAVGANHACALSSGGVVTCWGSNAQGQIDGKPSETGVWPPRRLSPGPGQRSP
jgi:hypothetical protein